MPKFSEFINFLNTDLKKDISKEDEEKILDKFHPNIKNTLYWEVDVNIKVDVYTFEGTINNDEHNKFNKFMEKKGEDFIIYFNSFDDEFEVELDEIEFSRDIDTIIGYLDSDNEDYGLMDRID